MPLTGQRPARFPTTRWSVVLRAGVSPTADSQQALHELFQTYWYPLYAFSRRSGNSHHDALDLTQGFFTHLLSGECLSTVSPDYGRFRSFLIAAFKNFMSNAHRASTAIRRGGNVRIVPLSEADFASHYENEPYSDETPELLFERSCVEALLSRVRQRLADEYARARKKQLFKLLEPHLTRRGEGVSQAQIGQELHLSPAAVAMSIHRMRRRFGELLREEVAATLNDPIEVEDELSSMMAVFRQG